MHYNDTDIVDAEFRVVTRSRWADWTNRLPNRTDQLAFLCVLLASVVLLGCLLASHHRLAVLYAVLLCTIGCLLSTGWRRYGALGVVLMALLSTTGCGAEAQAPMQARAMLASEKVQTPYEVQSRIRAATKYRDPREGWEPKRIDISNGAVKAANVKDAAYDNR